MRLYTFILDFRGGTYISQFKGINVETAMLNWAYELDTKPIAHLRKKHMKKIRKNLGEDILVEITGTKNVWCHSFLLGKHLALLNIVGTSVN